MTFSEEDRKNIHAGLDELLNDWVVDPDYSTGLRKLWKQGCGALTLTVNFWPSYFKESKGG